MATVVAENPSYTEPSQENNRQVGKLPGKKINSVENLQTLLQKSMIYLEPSIDYLLLMFFRTQSYSRGG